jgi:hypothetical protein
MFVPKVFAMKSLSFISNKFKVRRGIKEIIQTIVIVINIKEKRWYFNDSFAFFLFDRIVNFESVVDVSLVIWILLF